MNKTFKTAFIICTSIAVLGALLALVSDDRYKLANAGLLLLLFAVLYFFLGLILLIPKQARKAGQAMLLCSVIILVIGFSICSTASYSFH